MKRSTRPTLTTVLACLAFCFSILGPGTASAGATKVFDGTSYKTKPAIISGLHDYRGSGPISSARLLIGGPNAKPGRYGHIRWVEWTRKRAIGFGTAWHRGRLSYKSKIGANPWDGERVRVNLRRKKGKFNRLGITQRTSWRSGSEQGKCDYFLGFVFKPSAHRAHPWMQIGIGGGWPMKKRPCAGIRVS